MYLEVYPDIIFILNFFIDLLLLFLLKKVNRKKSSIPKLIGAAAVGALFAVIIGIFPWINLFLRFFLMNVASGFLMVYIAFGRLKRADLLKQVIALFLITYFVGGLMSSIYYYTNLKLILINLGNTVILSNISVKYVVIIMVLLIPLVLLVLRLYRWYQSGEKITYEVELVMEGKSVHTKGLMDTGNCLYDPIFKRPVMVIENSLTKELLSPEFMSDLENAKQYMEGNENIGSWDLSKDHLVRLRIIPYQSIGKTQGMMMGLMLDKVLINTGKETICNEKVTAAICDNHLSAKEDYQVILHKELL